MCNRLSDSIVLCGGQGSGPTLPVPIVQGIFSIRSSIAGNEVCFRLRGNLRESHALMPDKAELINNIILALGQICIINWRVNRRKEHTH